MKIQCNCGLNFELLSQIPENGQVNFKCNECDTYGFILDNFVYVQNEPHEYVRFKDKLCSFIKKSNSITDDAVFPPPWNPYEHPEKTEGWIEFQKRMKEDPSYYMGKY